MRRNILIILSVITLMIPIPVILAQAQNGYTLFSDPKGLFTMQVPQGWYCQGESYTDPTGLPSIYVNVVSPDKSVTISLGDPRLTVVYNTQVTGKQLAEMYYQNFIASSLQGLQVISDDELPDGSGAVGYKYGNYVGVVCAKTVPVGNNKWAISLFYNVIAPSSAISQAISIVYHMIRTTNSGNQQLNQMPAMGASTSAMYSDISNQNYQSTMHFLDESMRKTSNMINDRIDIWDPQREEAFNAPYGYPYQWFGQQSFEELGG